jgi:hypothetical protein
MQGRLSIGDASRFAGLALANIEREYPTRLDHVGSGEYAGEHWLATFAVLALTT